MLANEMLNKVEMYGEMSLAQSFMSHVGHGSSKVRLLQRVSINELYDAVGSHRREADEARWR